MHINLVLHNRKSRDTIARENALKVLIRSNPAGAEEIEDERNRWVIACRITDCFGYLMSKGGAKLRYAYYLTRIREDYVTILFRDPTFAAAKDVEQNVWKTCFYKKIEEYRKKIRRVAAAVSLSDNR